MLDIILLVLPLFTLIALGFISCALRVTNERTSGGLSDFVFIFATPALLFKLIVFNPQNEAMAWGYIGSYYIGMAISWGLVTIFTLKVLKASWGEAVVAGLSTGQANTVMIGIPLLIQVYGEQAASPIAFLLAVNLPITMTIATLLLEGGKASNPFAVAKQLLYALFTHPILLAIMAGLLWRYYAVPFPKLLFPALDMLAATAIPVSLITLGMGLREYGVKTSLKIVATVTIVKLLLFPAITFILAHMLFKLPPLFVGSAVIFASMPAGINAFLFAKRYGEGEDVAAACVAITTLISTLTIVLWLYLLPK